MSKSVPMFPDANPLKTTDWLYLLQGMNLDRDRKVTLGTLSDYVSRRGADVEVVTLDNAAPGPFVISTIAERSLVVLIQGDHTNVTQLQIAVEVPQGAVLTLLNGSTGGLATVAGNLVGLPYNCNPPVGTFAQSEVVELTLGPNGWFCQHAMDRNVTADSFTALGNAISSVASSLGTAISDEQTRAEGAEGDLATAITTESNRAKDAEDALGARVFATSRSPIKLKLKFNGNTGAPGFADIRASVDGTIGTSLSPSITDFFSATPGYSLKGKTLVPLSGSLPHVSLSASWTAFDDTASISTVDYAADMGVAPEGASGTASAVQWGPCSGVGLSEIDEIWINYVVNSDDQSAAVYLPVCASEDASSDDWFRAIKVHVKCAVTGLSPRFHIVIVDPGTNTAARWSLIPATTGEQDFILYLARSNGGTMRGRIASIPSGYIA